MSKVKLPNKHRGSYVYGTCKICKKQFKIHMTSIELYKDKKCELCWLCEMKQKQGRIHE